MSYISQAWQGNFFFQMLCSQLLGVGFSEQALNLGKGQADKIFVQTTVVYRGMLKAMCLTKHLFWTQMTSSALKKKKISFYDFLLQSSAC